MATGTDCNDSNDATWPGAPEQCDREDNDCDGDVDEGVLQEWYADADGDSFGNPASKYVTCDPPPGYVTDRTDCDDTTASAHPGSKEVCDTIDNDCDGDIDEDVTTTYYQDEDGDGYGLALKTIEACSEPSGYSDIDGDCNDSNRAISPNAVEICDDEDNDCDRVTDIDAIDRSTWYADSDGDGFGDEDTSVSACDAPAGYVSDRTDCLDSNRDVHPDATEVCDDKDNDCDGDIDTDATDKSIWYADSDGDGYGGTPSTTTCDQPSGYADNADDCDDGEPASNPEGEICDELDNDCDGNIDEGLTTVSYLDYDGDGYGGSLSIEDCTIPSGYVPTATDCDDIEFTTHPGADELCDNVDNDCDGETDEDSRDASTWYQDGDGDGYGTASAFVDACEAPSGYVSNDEDCDDGDELVSPDATVAWYDEEDSDCDGALDPDLCDDQPASVSVAADNSCAHDFADPADWSLSPEWASSDITYSVGSTYIGVMMTPVVGQLTDDNEDGLIDENDIPDIAYNTFSGSGYYSPGYLRVLSGDGSGEHFSVKDSSGTYVHASGGLAIGDIDGDCWPDLVTTSTDGYLIAIEGDGTDKWSSEAVTVTHGYCSPKIHDLDGDGDVEIVVCDDVFDSSGNWLFSTGGFGYFSPAVADVDNDGEMEIITGDKVYEPDGSTLYSTGFSMGISAGFVAVGNFDTDDYGEVVVRTGSTVYLFDDDGSTIWSTSVQGDGFPCIGDLDGDGEMEIGMGGKSWFVALDTDGSTMWSNAVSDSNHGTMGCTLFDMDGDGDHEVLFADRTDLFIWDGADGTELYNDPYSASGSLLEHPIVADVDADGMAEVIFPSNSYTYSGYDGITVLGEDNGEWVPVSLVWSQEDYSPVHINVDGSVPQNPPTPWSAGLGYRAQAAAGDLANGVPDWSATILGACADCDASGIELYVVVDNLGSSPGPAGTTVAVYAVDGSTTTFLTSQPLDGRVPAGTRAAPLRFSVDYADVGADGLMVVVDDNGTINECDEENNTDTWSGTCE